MKTTEEYAEMYETVKPFMKKEIPFDTFLFFTQIIESIKTDEDAMKLANFIKLGKIENEIYN